MTSRRALLTLPLLAACGKKPGTGYRGFAYVASAEEPSLVAIDLQSFSVKSRIPLPGPASHLISRSGRLFALIPSKNLIEVLDARTRSHVASLKLPGAPLTAVNHASGLWAVLSGAPQLYPIDATSLRAGPALRLPSEPIACDISPRDPVACLTLRDGAIHFADLTARIVHPPSLVDDTLGAVRFRSDGKLALIAGIGKRQLILVDTASREIVTQLPLSLSPDHFAMNPDGGQLFITGRGHDAVVIAYPYRTEIAQTSLSGRRPGQMATTTLPPYLYVSNPEAGSVTVFDISVQKVVAVIGVGVEPGAIVLTPDEQFALVLNRDSGDAAVIRIATIQAGRNKSAPLFTMIPVGARPACAVIVAA